MVRIRLVTTEYRFSHSPFALLICSCFQCASRFHLPKKCGGTAFPMHTQGLQTGSNEDFKILVKSKQGGTFPCLASSVNI